jgi:hypothetical protein
VNRCFLSRVAACRTRSSALGPPCRLGVRGAFCCREFPLARPLPSIPSATGSGPALFEDFSGTSPAHKEPLMTGTSDPEGRIISGRTIATINPRKSLAGPGPPRRGFRASMIT